MSALQILQTPELNEPTMIAAFAGWSDAGGAATGAAQYLIDRWHATKFADFDAEDFYDFTQLRPTVRWEGDERRIDWPENAFYHHRVADRDFIIFNGIEPHLHWRDYRETMMEAIRAVQRRPRAQPGCHVCRLPPHPAPARHRPGAR